MSVAKNILVTVGVLVSMSVASAAYEKAKHEIGKRAHPTFQMATLNKSDREKLEKFEDIFNSLAKDLKYDEKAQLKIEKDLDPSMELLRKNCIAKNMELADAKIISYSKAIDKTLEEYWDAYSKMIGAEVEKRGKGICRGFADLLVNNGHEIGLEIFRLESDKHAANIYKANGKWYVADLTTQITAPWFFKDKEYFYRMPLEYYLAYGQMAGKKKVMSVVVEGKRIPLDKFLETH